MTGPRGADGTLLAVGPVGPEGKRGDAPSPWAWRVDVKKHVTPTSATSMTDHRTSILPAPGL